jgi:hypothetical protein
LFNEIQIHAGTAFERDEEFYHGVLERLRLLCNKELHIDTNIGSPPDTTKYMPTSLPMLRTTTHSGIITHFAKFKTPLKFDRHKRGLKFVGDFLGWAFDTATKECPTIENNAGGTTES